MSIALSTLREKTRKYINEYVSTSDDFSNETTEILDAHIEAAARMVAQVAPLYTMALTNTTVNTSWSQRPDGRYTGVFQLPTDYMRLGSLTYQNLKRPITILLSNQHPNYSQEYSYIQGVGSGEYQPRAYETDQGVEVHSAKTSQDKEENDYNGTLYYVAVPKTDTATAQVSTLNDILIEPIAHQAAALYLSLTGDPNAQAAQQIASQALQLVISPTPTLSKGEGEQRG